jgi:uncharacterized protein
MKKIDKFAELERIFGTRRPIIGMVHLAPLPGSPRYDGMPMKEITDLAISEAQLLKQNGVNGAIIENFGDVMFYKRVPAETIAAITYAATNIAREVPDLTLGLCVLQSDAIASMAIANTIGGKFIRVPYYTETYIVDAGLMDSIAAETLRYRKFLNADVKIFADVHIKHGYPLSQRPIAQSAYDAEHRGLADAILVTGIATGAETKLDDVKEVKGAVEYTPVFVASGVDDKNLGSYSKYADGVIIGTHIKKNNDTEEPIDPAKLKHFMETARKTWAK